MAHALTSGGCCADTWCVLTVHRSESGTALAGGLARVLAAPQRDALAPELVAVPAKGVERWLMQQLSHHLGAEDGDGVCANVHFPHPSEVLDGAVSAASQPLATAVARWMPERAVLPL